MLTAQLRLMSVPAHRRTGGHGGHGGQEYMEDNRDLGQEDRKTGGLGGQEVRGTGGQED